WRSERPPRSRNDGPTEQSVTSASDPCANTEWGEATDDDNPLLGPVLSNEPASQYLVDIVDRGHRNRVREEPSPVLPCTCRSLLHDLGPAIAQQNGKEESAALLKVVKPYPMHLGHR